MPITPIGANHERPKADMTSQADSLLEMIAVLAVLAVVLVQMARQCATSRPGEGDEPERRTEERASASVSPPADSAANPSAP